MWRSYDYPHVVMLYFHMYEIAKRYPEMSKYLDAPGYLDRAWETARAFYTYPYELYPSYYETYKWGLYNELVVLDSSTRSRRGLRGSSRVARERVGEENRSISSMTTSIRSAPSTRSIARRSSLPTRSRSTARRTT